ncbi:unnamed protein product, partial [Meganyctiphanes norvegica]
VSTMGEWVSDPWLGGRSFLKAFLLILWVTECWCIYHPKQIFRESHELLTPIRDIGRSCPKAGISGCCHRPEDYLDLHHAKSLTDDLTAANFTFKSKACQCKCLCLDDPLCQAVTIIKPHGILGE